MPRFFAQNRSGIFYGMAFFSILLALLLLSPQAHANDPLSALHTMQQGVDKADSDTFMRAVDLDSVLNKASGTLMDTLRQQAAAGNLGDSNIAMALTLATMAEDSGQGAFIRQLLVSEVKGFVVSGINGGYFAGKPNGSVKPARASLASTLEKMPQGRREIIPGKVLSNAEGKAEVSGTFSDPEAGRFPVTLALEKRGEQWVVVEITNADELFEKAAKGGKAKVQQ